MFDQDAYCAHINVWYSANVGNNYIFYFVTTIMQIRQSFNLLALDGSGSGTNLCIYIYKCQNNMILCYCQ